MKHSRLIFCVSLVVVISAASLAARHVHEHQEPEPGIPAAPPPADPHGHEHAHESAHEAGHDGGNEQAHADEVKLTADAVARNGITLGAATKQLLTPTISAPARVTFNLDAIAHVGSVLRGRAVELKVRMGDNVRKDDELLVVESPELGELQTDFLQKLTALSVAEASVEPAKQALVRARALFEQNQGIALGEVQRREVEHRAAAGALTTARSAVTASENKLHLLGMARKDVEALSGTGKVMPRAAIKAPLAGRVTAREVTLGELVSPEKEALFVIADMSSLWVIADVPDTKLTEVAVGAKARVHLAGASVVEGTVSLIGSELDPATRTGKVRIAVPNLSGRLRPGLFARVEITASEAAAGNVILAVPDEAVMTVEGGPAVFIPVEGEENTFAKRAVTVGKSVGGMTPILKGLEDGQQVVVSGVFILKAELGKSGAAHEH